MKKLLLFGVTALVLFAASFTVSYFLQRSRVSPPAGPDGGGKAEGTGKGRPAAPPDAQRSVARPPLTPATDEAVQLAGSLRERLSAVREKEKKLADREKRLELVTQDIRGERTAIDELRKQVGEELKAVSEKLAAVERRQGEVQQQRQDMSGKLDELKKQFLELEGVERKNFEKMATMYDSMPPENAARILQHLADSGKMDTAVKLLGQMKERNAAKVLAELTEPALAAQLLDRLKGLKRPSAAATPPPLPAPEKLPPAIEKVPAAPEKVRVPDRP